MVNAESHAVIGIYLFEYMLFPPKTIDYFFSKINKTYPSTANAVNISTR